MPREKLPDRRRSETVIFDHVREGANPRPVEATLGFYADGRLGEVFLSAAKVNTDMEIAVRDAAILLSFALQHGAKLEEMQKAITRNDHGGPDGIVGTLLDLIVRPDAN